MKMSARAKWSAFGIFGVFLAVAAIDAGCGSDSFTSDTSTDGGSDGAAATDGSTADGNADSGAPGCLTPPTAVPDADVAFCQAFAEVYSRCGSCEECRQKDVNNCASFGDAFSDAFKTAMIACKDTYDCNDLQVQSLGSSPCVGNIVNNAAPTLAQQGAKTAYCNACADAGSDMPCDFFFGLPDGGATSGTAILYMSDGLATDLGAQCANHCGQLSYLVCEGIHVCSATDAPPKTTCTQGICK